MAMAWCYFMVLYFNPVDSFFLDSVPTLLASLFENLISLPGKTTKWIQQIKQSFVFWRNNGYCSFRSCWSGDVCADRISPYTLKHLLLHACIRTTCLYWVPRCFFEANNFRDQRLPLNDYRLKVYERESGLLLHLSNCVLWPCYTQKSFRVSVNRFVHHIRNILIHYSSLIHCCVQYVG